MYHYKKNILFLTAHLPYPLLSGGRLREYEIIKRISKVYNIYLVAVTKTYAADLFYAPYLQEFCKEVQIFSSLPPNVAKDFKNRYPNKVIRIISSEANTYIQKLLETNVIDLIHLESFYMHYYFPKVIAIPIVLAAQNIEFDIIKQKINIKGTNNELRSEYKLTKKYEILSWKYVDICITLTQEDYNLMKNHVGINKIKLMHNGYDHLAYNRNPPSTRIPDIPHNNTILITGNYQYEPNQDAVVYFCTKIFPEVKKLINNVKLYIVGNEPTPEVLKFSSIKDIEIIGNVSNISDYLKYIKIFVCPLRLGGGIKVKMLEALFYNAAIVTSPVGAQGLPVVTPPAFWVANTDNEFVDYIILLLTDLEKRENLKRSTKKAIEKLWTWKYAASCLTKLYSDILYKKR